MGENSAIEWTDHTFNIVWGCSKISPACKNCYAETFSKRVGLKVWGQDAERRTFGAKHWAEPLKWNAKAAKDGLRRRVFCSSMADVFEDHPTVAAERERLWPLIAETPNLDWLLLTKRPENVLAMVPYGTQWPANVWLGTTVENQEYADIRVPHLLAVPAAVRFLSCEPLLEPIDFSGRRLEWLDPFQDVDASLRRTPRINWVIVGGESGHGARPIHPDWARSIRDQCVAANVPFLFKQWGDWGPVEPGQFGGSDICLLPDGNFVGAGHRRSGVGMLDGTREAEGTWLYRSGKKIAGRELDGRTWDGFPEVTR